MQIARRSSLVFTAVLAVLLGGAFAVIGAKGTPLGPGLGLVPVVAVLWVGLRGPIRRWRAAQQPLGDAHRQWIADHVALYTALGAAARTRFERDVRFILEEWRFEQVQEGQPPTTDVDDDLRLGVAAGAALLLHGRPDWELGPPRTILFYPDRFDDTYFGGEGADFDGMAHAQGPIILSAPAVREDWAHGRDGHNVVLHELAHLFDFANQFADGVPSLLDPSSAPAWAKLVRREMQRIKIGRSLLRSYGATNEAEFFAVAVEMFFERPEALQRRHRELYEALVAFFNLDPMGVERERVERTHGLTE